MKNNFKLEYIVVILSMVVLVATFGLTNKYSDNNSESNSESNSNNVALVDKISVKEETDIQMKIYNAERAAKKVEIAKAVEAPKEENKIISRGASPETLLEAPKPKTEAKGIMPTKGSLSSKYGQRWGSEHKGIDIAASTGTAVYAFMDGTVTFSGWDDGGYGNLVIIKHSNGLESYYAHNSKVSAKVGQKVTAGTIISNVGSTGRSTGPHLHFEVRKNGEPVNPFNYLN